MYDCVKGFCTEVNKLYWAEENRITFADPLKVYHGFMVDTINRSSTIMSLVLRIVHVVTGVFAYPIFGAFAALDVLIKYLNWKWMGGKDQNEHQKDIIKSIFNGRIQSLFHFKGVNGRVSDRPFKQFLITSPKNPQELDPKGIESLVKEMSELIDKFSDAYTQVSVQSFGDWSTGKKILFLGPMEQWFHCKNPNLFPQENVKLSFLKD